MKRIICLVLVFVLGFFIVSWAEEKGLLIDDFQGEITGGPDGTVDFGAGNGSTIDVSAAGDIVHSGKQSLKVTFDAVAGGYLWVARGFGLDAKRAGWLVKPEEIDWAGYKTIAFYVYGDDSKTKVALDIKDSGNEMWRIIFEDNFKGWKQIICPFNEFSARSDWQPRDADNNARIDFPIKSFQFEPKPEAKGTLYFADVQLIGK